MARHLELIIERRRRLERRCDDERAGVMVALFEVRDHFQPLERAVGKVRRLAKYGMLGFMARRMLGGGEAPRRISAPGRIARVALGAVKLVFSAGRLLFRRRRRYA